MEQADATCYFVSKSTTDAARAKIDGTIIALKGTQLLHQITPGRSPSNVFHAYYDWKSHRFLGENVFNENVS